MNFRENLPRWILASASRFFQSQLQGKMNFYMEGEERRTEGLADYVEFRLDGPYLVESTKGCYKIDMEINVLVVCFMDSTDFHKIYRLCGLVLGCFNAIPIYKLGDGIDDDQSLIDYMIINRSFDQREATRVTHFGRLEPDKPILQSSVEGHYFFYVSE